MFISDLIDATTMLGSRLSNGRVRTKVCNVNSRWEAWRGKVSKVCEGPEGCLEATRGAGFGKDIFLIFYILSTDMQFFRNFLIFNTYRDRCKYPDLQWGKCMASGTR